MSLPYRSSPKISIFSSNNFNTQLKLATCLYLDSVLFCLSNEYVSLPKFMRKSIDDFVIWKDIYHSSSGIQSETIKANSHKSNNLMTPKRYLDQNEPMSPASQEDSFLSSPTPITNSILDLSILHQSLISYDNLIGDITFSEVDLQKYDQILKTHVELKTKRQVLRTIKNCFSGR